MTLADPPSSGVPGSAPRRRLPAGVRPLSSATAAPTQVGSSLDRVLKGLGLPSTVAGVEVVFERWPDVVGPAMAARTRPVTISRDTLVVGCDDPAVATHVRFLEPQLVARLGELAGERRITRVEVRVERGGGRRRSPRPPRRG